MDIAVSRKDKKMKSKLVSVIIPVYNVERYVGQCIESVLNQTYKNIEVILIDDGSIDKSSDICDYYAKKDTRVKVIHKENGGLSSARNAGIAVATGDYGIYIDSDDYWIMTTGLEVLLNRVLQFEIDVLSFNYIKYDERSGVLSSKHKHLDTENVIGLSKAEQLNQLTKQNLFNASACNKLIKMCLLKRLPFEYGMCSEDIEWCAKLMLEAKRIDYMNLDLYCYRQREGSISKTIKNKSCQDLAKAILSCVKIAETADSDIRVPLYRYTAYQFSTFIAVQAFAEQFQSDSIKKLQPYVSILKYFTENRKVKYMYIGTRIFGLKGWCYIIKFTRNIWSGLR